MVDACIYTFIKRQRQSSWDFRGSRFKSIPYCHRMIALVHKIDSIY